MDPPLVSESSFSAANPSAYSLLEIWPFGSQILRSGSAEDSAVTEQSGGRRKRRDLSSQDDSSKLVSSTTAIPLGKKAKVEEGAEFENGVERAEVEGSSVAEKETKPSEPPKQDFIHVRARRGQATDSHSLAERARREKISERMKLLQDLVPGCNKVIGKALVLDEIINYIQSLQRQVEFLSMKLETVNSRMNLSPSMDGFSSKELNVQPFDTTGLLFGSQAPREYDQGSHPDWLHMQVGGNFERPT